MFYVYTFVVFVLFVFFFFFFNDTATTEIYTLSLHDALPICQRAIPRAAVPGRDGVPARQAAGRATGRSEEHTSELQSRLHLVCRLLLEKKKKKKNQKYLLKQKKRKNIQ